MRSNSNRWECLSDSFKLLNYIKNPLMDQSTRNWILFWVLIQDGWNELFAAQVFFFPVINLLHLCHLSDTIEVIWVLLFYLLLSTLFIPRKQCCKCQISNQICVMFMCVYLLAHRTHLRLSTDFNYVAGFFFPSRFHPDLQLSEAQVVWLRATHRPAALQDCIAAIVTAEGHLSVTSALSRLNLHVLVDRLALPHVPTYSCRKTLQSLSWQAAMTR